MIRSALLLSLIFGAQSASAILRLPGNTSASFDFEYDVIPHFDDAMETSRNLLTSEEILDSLDICGGFELIANQMPDGEKSCVCQNNQVLCTFQGTCDPGGTVCTDVVSIVFQFLVRNDRVNRMKLSACFTYTDEFDVTCIETQVGRGTQLQTCNRATYGGKQCLCGICRDRKSLALDCSRHHPMATSNGCYRLADALPPLAKFNEK